MSEKVIINVETDKETVDQLICTVKEYSNIVDGPPPLNLRKLLKDIEEGVERKCVYKRDYNCFEDPYYSASCGEEFVFIEEGPEENNYNYCPGCAGKIEVVKREVDDE